MGTTLEITDKESFKAQFTMDFTETMFPWVEAKNRNVFEVTQPIFDSTNENEPLPNPSNPKIWNW